ncbi:glycosyltransferase [Gordonia neofelifaecis]|uniref:Glycosyl transferase family 2 n=1 Tax=Gordonia neofelifaecis NRRL B-59395 TaxID=644548 RepID=F1YEZ4_9ACTN|nr:glycosyltransferase [Gordonia neofelifaecis]EGD56978.1 glycosyl transferase family 2 [Gordonia neofelifaecis NRRL B-59395]
MSDRQPNRTKTLLQRTFFASETPRIEPALYADGTAVRAERDRAVLSDGARLSTDTYFGRFAATYWQRYTDLAAVTVELDYDCSDGATLTVQTRASDISGRVRPLSVERFTGAGTAVMDVRIDRFLDGGAAWFDLAADGGSVSVSAARWLADAAPVRDRRVSVVICTFNRPDDAVATVGAVAGDADLAERVEAVHLVDQGTARVSDNPGFAGLADLLGDRLNYLNQANLGGSGGFSRGIYESTAQGRPVTDVLVMDDDILCEPESILRMTSFAQFARKPMLVGAQMLLLSETTRIHMTAETDDLAHLDCTVPPPNARRGVDALEFRQDKRVIAGYNAWWSCLIPREAIDAVGLPMPYFIKWDDIEYGVRCRGAGFPTATLPNAGVWHADFHLKDIDDWSSYFGQRNVLISSAIHSAFDGKTIAATMAKHIGESIVGLKYGQAAIELEALRDFLAGPYVLADGGRAKLAEINAMRRDFDDTRVRPASEIADPPVIPSPPAPAPKWERGVLVKRAAQQILGRTAPGQIAVGAFDATWWHVGRFASAVVTDASQTGVRVRTYDRALSLAQGRELAALCWELRKHAPELQRAWREAVPQLTSRENWERLFAVD